MFSKISFNEIFRLQWGTTTSKCMFDIVMEKISMHFTAQMYSNYTVEVKKLNPNYI